MGKRGALDPRPDHLEDPMATATAARPYARARLVLELHTLSNDDTCVITAQRWQDPQRADRQWLVVLRNGTQVAGRAFTGGRGIERLDAELTRLRAGWARCRGFLDAQMAHTLLERLAGVRPERCAREDCAEVLPLGRRHCQGCGAAAGRVAAGLMSGANRRGVLVLTTG
ncbi:hypothetical protein JNW90_24215 [Micromonospora sp. STR1s_5]|nr:hypothetical protein [Micromonospora sp. STR1s_5]